MIWDHRHRLEAILQEKVALIVQRHLNDPRLGFLTVTRTELSKDRKVCKVYYTVLGTEGQARTTARALKAASPRVRELLAPTLAMRTLPEVQFLFDETVERESHMHELIDKLAAERPPQPPGEPLPEVPDEDEPLE